MADIILLKDFLQSQIEFWRVVPFNREYAVSSMGRVRREVAAHSSRAGKILKPGVGKALYPHVALQTGSKTKSVNVHILMAHAFFGSPPLPKMTVNHKNGIKTVNYLDNLEWATQRDNNLHALRTGLRGTGAVKTPDEIVREIKRRRAMGETQISIARDYNITRSMVSLVSRGLSRSKVV